MSTKEPLERILAREWNQSLKPYEYHITPEFNRLIEAGWAYKRMSMHGYWIIGWTELGWAAATMCGLCEMDKNLVLEMGAEIERLRAEVQRQAVEIAALREALDAIYDRAELGWDDLQGMRLAVMARAQAALAAKPDAAPAEAEATIRVGDTVRVKETEERGKLFMEFESPYLGKQYRVEFTNGEYADYDRDEIEPA